MPTATPRPPVTLADIDGTQPGTASLVSQPPPGQVDYRVFILVFAEGEDGCTDPVASCELVRRSMAEAFPRYTNTTASNPRARFIAWRGTQDAAVDSSTEAYLADLAQNECTP